MKVSPQANSASEVFLTLVPVSEAQKLYQRKTQALKLVAECKQYISHKTMSTELRERVKALMDHDNSLTTTEAIVVLLDYTEREFREITRLEKGQVSLMAKAKNFFQVFTNIFE